MSSEWLPVLVVLAIGVVAGLAFALRFGRRRTNAGAPDKQGARRRSGEATEGRGDAADELRRADLEARRDELYEQLRRAETDDDRRQLEDQAARVLRALDELGGERVAARSQVKAGAAAAASTPSSSGHPMLVGFLGGAAMVGLVGLLIYFAVRDAKPRDEETGMAAPAAMGGEHPTPDLPPETRERIEQLRRQVAADPGDLMARKQLSMALLATQQFFEAFQVSGEILNVSPSDPDGLYVQGMVRLTMGQDDMAAANLDMVLAQYPDHVLALAGRGMILIRGGDREGAIEVWERALAAAGGSHPDLQALLDMARDPQHAAQMAASGQTTSSGSAPGAAQGPAPSEPASAPPAEQAAVQAVGPDEFGVLVDLAPGVVVPRGTILFVFLKESETGPPTAVRRIQSPRFPLAVALGPGDSMMGRPLPSEGMITVRLDADGSATTRGDNDLAVEGRASAGESIRLTLGGG